MIKHITLFLLIIFFGIVASTTVHEMFHQYDFSKIDEVCFFGYLDDDDLMQSGGGWIKADDYWHFEEKIPTIAGAITASLVAITLGFIFRDELRWW